MKGFTLVETIVTVFVFTLAMGAIAGFIIMGYQTQTYTFQQSQAIGEAKKGVETMMKEIREARTGEGGSYILAKAEDYQFSFYSDVDDDLEIEKIRYFIDGTDFKKGVIDPEGTPAVYPEDKEEIFILSKYVRNQPPIFKYFNGEGDELPPPARRKDTKLMKVYLVINVDPNRPPQDFVLESNVQIRNLKTNL
jgi:type II secretory pathway pseudopilin PulG